MVGKTLKQIPAGSRILDAGGGERQYERFCTDLNYVAQDFARYDGKGNGAGLQMESWDQSNLDIILDITAIPEPDTSFGANMCVEVFEYVPEPAKAVEEFSRILKPSGILILTAPFCSLTHFAPYYFTNGFSRYWYKKILKENNFIINEIGLNGNYFEYLAHEIRRIPSVGEKYSKFNLFESIINRVASSIILKRLGKLSQDNENSEELLCFGLNTLATKK